MIEIMSMDRTKILCIGDLHFKTDNVQESEELIRKTIAEVKRRQVDIVVIMGDILHDHERVHTDPFNRAVKFFRRLSKLATTYVLIGNHDYINNSQFMTERHPFNALKYWGDELVIVDKAMAVTHGSFELFFVPYVPVGRFVEALDSTECDWMSADCIFAHQEFEHAKLYDDMTSTDGDSWGEDYPIVISGHIHTRHTIGENIYYIGSAMQTSFADTSDKSGWLIEFTRDEETEEASIEMEDVDTSSFIRKTMVMTVDEAKRFDPATIEESVRVRIKIRDTHEVISVFRRSATYMTLVSAGVKIVFYPILRDRPQISFDDVKNPRKRFEETLGSIIREEGAPEKSGAVLELLMRDDDSSLDGLMEKLKM